METMSKEALLAKVILDYITLHPELHNQELWVDIHGMIDSVDQLEPCGTSACVAGYAVLFSNDPHFEFEVERGYVEISPVDDVDKEELFYDRGRKLLGLDHEDANSLFYRTSNEEARKALVYLAQGEEIDWDEVYDV